MRKLCPDILCLNEVDVGKRPACLQDLEQETSLSCEFFVSHGENGAYRQREVVNSPEVWPRVEQPHVGDPPRYGNAILYNARTLKLAGRSEHRLPGGTVYSFPKGTELLSGDGEATGEETRRRIVRGCLELTFEGLTYEGGLTVATTHLDHINEAERLTQSRALAEILRDKPAVLAGDLNALTREDYSAEAWDALRKRAEDRDWAFGASDAKGGCLWHLKKDRGFVDLWQKAAVVGNEQESSSSSGGGSGPSSRNLTAHGLYRIDYVLGTPQLSARVPRAFVADARAWGLEGVSDHSPVVVDLEMDGRRVAKM